MAPAVPTTTVVAPRAVARTFAERGQQRVAKVLRQVRVVLPEGLSEARVVGIHAGPVAEDFVVDRGESPQPHPVVTDLLLGGQ